MREIAHMKRLNAGEYRSRPNMSTEYLLFNVNIPPFHDARVRRAFVLATDRLRLGELGKGMPVTGGFVPPGMPGHIPGIALPFKPEEARRLMAEAGYPGGKNFPVLKVALMPWVVHYMPDHLLKLWEELLGVTIVWKEIAWADYFEHMRHKQSHIFNLGWGADYPDPDNFLRVCLSERADWRHEAYEALIEEARHSLDHDLRLHLFRQAEEILIQEAPILPYLYQITHMLVKPWIKNCPILQCMPDTIFAPKWHQIIIEPH